MNILFLTNHLNIGGISSYLLSLGKGLKYRSHNVYVASSGGELVPKFTAEGIDFVPIPIKTKFELHPKIVISYAKLSKFRKEKKIDIIHANTRVTQVLAALLSAFSGIPYISTCHGFFKNNIGRKLFPLWGDRVIAISDSVKKHLIEDFNVKGNRIRVIYNGIDTNRFNRSHKAEYKNQMKQGLGLKDGAVVGIIARLSDVKGHCYLIEAMRNVISQLPNAQLLIVGEGKEKDNLLKQVRKSQIEGSVKFISSVEDTTQILPVMDLFVMPSLQEGLGLAVMEAQAAGLAVVASNIGGLNNLIKDGFNGRLVFPKDVKSLSAAIIELLEDKTKANLFGLNGQHFIEENFSLDIMVRQTEGVYKECVTRHNESR